MSTKSSRLAKKYINMCKKFSIEENLSKEETQKLCGLVGVFVTSLVNDDGPIEFKKGGIFDKINNIYDENGNIKREIIENANEFIKKAN